MIALTHARPVPATVAASVHGFEPCGSMSLIRWLSNVQVMAAPEGTLLIVNSLPDWHKTSGATSAGNLTVT